VLDIRLVADKDGDPGGGPDLVAVFVVLGLLGEEQFEHLPTDPFWNDRVAGTGREKPVARRQRASGTKAEPVA